jgi:hypothetical protein
MSREKVPLTQAEIKALTDLKNSEWVTRIYGTKGLWCVRHDVKCTIPRFLSDLMDSAYDQGQEDLRHQLCKLIGARR